MFHIQICSFKHYWNCVEKNYQHLIKLSFKIYEKILFQLMIPDKCSWHQLTCLSRRYCGCHMWRWQFFNQRFMMLLTREKLVVLIKLKMRKITMVMGKFKKKILTDNAKKILQKDDNWKSVRGKIFFNAPLPVSFVDVNGPDSTQKRTFFISIFFCIMRRWNIKEKCFSN